MQGAIKSARTTIPTCIVLGVLLTLIGLIRLLAGEGSAWQFGEPSIGWFLLLCGLIAIGGAVLLMRFVVHRLPAAT